jgi:hypothetical protein
MRRIALLLAAALSFSTQECSAQESSIGVRAHGLAPMGDLRDLTDNQVGLGAAVFVSIPIGRGMVLRPLVGAQFIPKGDTLSPTGTKASVASVDLMLDALWYPDEDPERGAYLVGSVGAQQWRVRTTGDAPSTLSATRLGVSGGLGYQFTAHFAVEARGFWSPIEKDLTATGLILGVTLRF